MRAEPPDAPGFRLATFDLDGTLTRVHGWSVIAKATHREEAFRESQARFLAHEVGEDEHLRELLELAVGLSVAEVERLLEATPKLADIGEALATLRAVGVRSALLTHNPEYVCAWYARRFGFDAAEGTRGTVVGGDGTILAVGPTHADKAGGLARLLERFDLAAREVVHVGDGWADAALFPQVGAGIALNTSDEAVTRAADVSLRAESLRAIVPVIRRLRPRPLVNGARPPDEGSNR